MKGFGALRVLAVSSALVAGLAVAASAQTGSILIGDGVRIHPESIAAIPNGGGLLIGSTAQNGVYRWNPGDETATPWVSLESIQRGGRILGVFAEGNNAWVCANGPSGTGLAMLVGFDLTTATETGRYPLPDNGHGGGSCNDMAVSADGTLFVSETNGRGAGRILALVADNNGVKSLITVIGSNSLGGVDGLAFIGDTLYVNDVLANKLYRLDLNGTALISFTVLNVDMDLGRPDGMRTTLDGTALLMAEGGANRVDMVTIDGDNAHVTVLQDTGLTQPTGIAQIGNTAYVVESRSGAVVNQNQLPFIANPAADPGPFYAIAVPLP